MEYEYTELYYSTPIQVKYYDRDSQQYRGGIALKDFLITSEGEIVSLDSIITFASLDNISFDDAIIELSWEDLSSFILG